MKYCQGCGLTLPPTVRFCPACGVRNFGPMPPTNAQAPKLSNPNITSTPSVGAAVNSLVVPPPELAAPLLPPALPPPTAISPVGPTPVPGFYAPPVTMAGPEPSLFSLFVGSLTKRYFQFSGRARRREYWGFFLFSYIGSVLMSLVLMLGGLRSPELDGAFFLCWSGPLLIPFMAVAVRRLHDVGVSGYLFLGSSVWFWGGGAATVSLWTIDRRRDGWGAFIGLLWIIGFLVFFSVVLYYMLKRGEHGPNRFGPDPKLVAGSNDGFGYFGATTPYPGTPSMAQCSSSTNPPSGQWPSPPQHCGQCGHAVNPGLLFCTNCGSRRT